MITSPAQKVPEIRIVSSDSPLPDGDRSNRRLLLERSGDETSADPNDNGFEVGLPSNEESIPLQSLSPIAKSGIETNSIIMDLHDDVNW